MTNTNKKNNKRKLLGAVGMLSVSAAMLVSSTFAWFTMNKQVKATSMEVKAHAEEGLLINEVAAPGNTWDDVATANQTTADQAIQLRPASTKNLTDWWHANSKKTNNEAGYGSGTVDAENTIALGSGTYYSDIKFVSADDDGGVRKYEQAAASAGSQAETNVYYKDATYGSAGTYDSGEGYYVEYKYYIKSSSSDGLNVKKDKFMVSVTPTKKNSETSGTSDNLDKALRVGVKIDNSVLIFAPLYNSNQTYKVTNNVAGSNYGDDITAYTSETAIGTAADTLAIPGVNATGMEVDVYIWFEGEDTNCKSDYLTTVLDTYNFDITFRDADFT